MVILPAGADVTAMQSVRAVTCFVPRLTLDQEHGFEPEADVGLDGLTTSVRFPAGPTSSMLLTFGEFAITLEASTIRSGRSIIWNEWE